MKESPEFAEAFAEIHAAAGRPCLDEQLLDACDRYLDLAPGAERLLRQGDAGAVTRLDEAWAEQRTLLREIIGTDAQTPYGFDMKLQVLRQLTAGMGDAGRLAESLASNLLCSGRAFRGL